jgi:hypothetical protein
MEHKKDFFTQMQKLEAYFDSIYGKGHYRVETREFPISGRYYYDEDGTTKYYNIAGTMDMIVYDDKGNITDYTSEMEKLYKELNAAETKMNGMSTKEAQDEYKETVVKDIQDRIDLLTEAIEQYDETRELIEDLDKDIREGEWAVEDLEFETFEYEIELKIEIDDRDLEYLEYLLGKIEDKAFAARERISLITQQTDEIISKSKTTREAISTILGDNLSKEDKKLFYDGKIDQIDW